MLIHENDVIVFAGDSVTDAGRDKSIPAGAFAGMGQGYVRFISQALVTTYPEFANMVVNAGVSGDDSAQLLERFEADVLTYCPQIVCILIGINDVWRWYDQRFQRSKQAITTEQFGNNYQLLIDMTRSAKATPVLMSPFMFEKNIQDPMRRRLSAYQEVVEILAQSNHVRMIDVQSVIDQFLTIESSYTLSLDRVHPNEYGHFLVARTFLNAIDLKWQHTPKER
ncbi:MAG: SGNH/GDSL hydrolase family protein [Lactobacillus sp.]|jgi:lysophospholipase L1-like esterase|nr:SGNH/GDSL hydrolase family protein [Lactobacillus sp.]MCI2031919.1 SGNH/GDSL hydrolase family protein [Lactobacillus sp.]